MAICIDILRRTRSRRLKGCVKKKVIFFKIFYVVEEKCNLKYMYYSGVVNVKVGSRSMAILRGEIQLLYSFTAFQL